MFLLLFLQYITGNSVPDPTAYPTPRLTYYPIRKVPEQLPRAKVLTYFKANFTTVLPRVHFPVAQAATVPGYSLVSKLVMKKVLRSSLVLPLSIKEVAAHRPILSRVFELGISESLALPPTSVSVSVFNFTSQTLPNATDLVMPVEVSFQVISPSKTSRDVSTIAAFIKQSAAEGIMATYIQQAAFDHGVLTAALAAVSKLDAAVTQVTINVPEKTWQKTTTFESVAPTASPIVPPSLPIPDSTPMITPAPTMLSASANATLFAGDEIKVDLEFLLVGIVSAAVLFALGMYIIVQRPNMELKELATDEDGNQEEGDDPKKILQQGVQGQSDPLPRFLGAANSQPEQSKTAESMTQMKPLDASSLTEALGGAVSISSGDSDEASAKMEVFAPAKRRQSQQQMTRLD
jgi:hypothetical protein